MATLAFPGSAVLELLAHAKAAPEHSAGYTEDANPGPGLFLVKDSGIYLMSNGKPGLPRDDGTPGNRVVYAKGYESAPAIRDRGGDWGDQYSKIEAAAGGDDFVELLPASAFRSLEPGGTLNISLTATQVLIDVLAPRAERNRSAA